MISSGTILTADSPGNKEREESVKNKGTRRITTGEERKTYRKEKEGEKEKERKEKERN